MIESIIIATFVGVFGTGIGGAIGAFASKTEKILRSLLYFTAGVMMGMAFFDLLPEAMEGAPLYITVLGLAIGVLLVFSVEKLESRSARKNDAGGNKMVSAGFVILIALMMHNLPEGFVIGAGHAENLGNQRAWLIALHNIPGGMAVALPMISGGFSKGKAILMAAISGVPLVLGAAIGSLAGGFPQTILSLLLAITAGSMLFVSAYEISMQQDSFKQQGIKIGAMLAAGMLLAFVFTHF